jgi:hypothetical protein
MNVRKVRNVRQIKDNIYICDVEIYSPKENSWNKIPYVVNTEDDSEINLWILGQILKGKYKITNQRV